MRPTRERLHKEWRAIYRGWERAGQPKTADSPVLRLARKYRLTCQEIRSILGLTGRPIKGYYFRIENRED